MKVNTLLVTPEKVINHPDTPAARNIFYNSFLFLCSNTCYTSHTALFYEKNNAIAAIPVIRADQVRPIHEIKPEPIITDSSLLK